jgi:hypothetical protein
MPDAPFCSIDPWSRSPGEATNISEADDDVSGIAAELRRLRHELRAVQGATPKETRSVRRPCMAPLGPAEGGTHEK